MNKVFLIGRLVKDPEIRYTSNDVAVATFTLAVNRQYTNEKGEREADFINIIVWRKQAENISKYLSQGSQISVDGKIQTRTYEDKKGKHYITEVIADNVEFLSRKNTQPEVKQEVQKEENIQKNEETVQKDPFEEFGRQIEIEDDELPF